MVFPFSGMIEKLSSLAHKAIPSQSEKINALTTVYPAIHRYKEVGEWIIQNFLPDLSYDMKFKEDFSTKYST